MNHVNVRIVQPVAAVAAGLLVVGLAAGPAGAAPRHRRISSPAVAAGRAVAPVAHGVRLATMNQSNNWAGYDQGLLEKGRSFTSASATWVVPAATQHASGQAEGSSVWVGIGGGCVDGGCNLTDPTLVQAGTEQDVAADGTPSYYAWFETIPAPAMAVPLAVHPGDTVSVSVSEPLPEAWVVSISDLTTQRRWSTSFEYTSTNTTAEWIVETPTQVATSGVGLTALPSLGSVHLSRVLADGQPAGLGPAERLQLVDGAGHPVATPSLPGTGGTSFAVCTFSPTC